MDLIKIGTIISMGDAPKIIDQIKDYGFESFQLTNWMTTANINMKENALRVKESLGGTNIQLSSLSIFCNPI